MRTNKKGELFSHLTQLAVCRDAAAGGATTLSANLAAGQTNVGVAAIANFADQDLARIGSGEDVEIVRVQGAPAGNAITSAWPTGKAHVTGDAVVEQVLTDLGHLTDDGVKVTFSGDDTAVQSATRRLALGYLIGHMEIMFEASLEGMNLENLATALGMKESRIVGAGTQAAPSTLFVDGTQVREENDLCFQATGVRKDGQIVTVQFLGVELNYGALQTALARGQVAPIPLQGRCTSGIRYLLNT